MENSAGLTDLNRNTILYIQGYINKSSRFSAASKFGVAPSLIDKISQLDAFEVQEVAQKYADKEILITCSNLTLSGNLDVRSTTLDSYFKNSHPDLGVSSGVA